MALFTGNINEFSIPIPRIRPAEKVSYDLQRPRVKMTVIRNRPRGIQEKETYNIRQYSKNMNEDVEVFIGTIEDLKAK